MATWTISTLEHNTADGGVIVAHWRVTEEETVGDDTYSASAYGTASFTYDASSPDFIPYADLTEEVVLGWCFDGDVDKDAIEASLTANIEEQKNPVTEAGVPW
jgi:hypothetical protein